MSDNRKYAQLQPFSLAGSGVVSTATTIVLTSFQDIDGNDLSMSAFGTKGYGTLEPGSSDKEEQFSFTGVTQNSNGTATLTGVSHVDFLSPYTETSGLTKAHAGGTTMVISNTSGFYNEFANKQDDETIVGLWTFPNDANTPLIGVTYVAPTIDNQVASKKYVDDVAVSGAPDANPTTKGLVQIATNAQMGTGTQFGSTGAWLVPPNNQLVKTSSGAGDENKIAVLNSSGQFAAGFVLIDTPRTWATVQTFPADDLQINSDANSGNDAVRNSYLTNKFFGTGADGAFSQSSGTTTLNTAGKFIYQYTSFSLTGTASLTTGGNLTNHPVLILVQGDLTITSSTVPAVNVSSQGAPAGTGGVSGGAAATDGSLGSTVINATVSSGGGTSGTGGGGGGGGGAGLGNSGAAGGAGAGTGTAGSGGNREAYDAGMTISRLLDLMHLGSGGAGGGGGAAAAAVGGNGGVGGGCIVFVVGGNINITSTFTAAGAAGSAGTTGGGQNGGGGGGGGGGFIGIFYGGTVTANTATLTVTGGAGGNGPSDAGDGGAGGDGQAVVRAISSWIPA